MRFPMFERRLGLFIHWGIYSMNAWHEQEQGRLSVSHSDYEKYAAVFNPTFFNPDEWIDMALDAGMSYMVFTAKHHDGYCMWDTKTTDYCCAKSPCGGDILKRLAEACAKRDFPLGLYYSNPDWHHPCAYNSASSHQIKPEGAETDFPVYQSYIREQISELLTNYGRIVCLFWDIPPKIADAPLQELVRVLQPGIWVNDRGWGEGDYSTPERESAGNAPFSGNVEACQSVGVQSWGYRKNEDYYSASFLMKCAGDYLLKGANYLLNVGPRADGSIPPQARDILHRLGGWHNKVREALEAQWRPELSDGYYSVSVSENRIYLLLPPCPRFTGFAVDFVSELPERVVLLNTGDELGYELERFPSRYNAMSGFINRDCLHIVGLDCDMSEPAVIRIDCPLCTK